MALDLERIHKSVRKLRKFLKKSPRRPTSEQIHDLRTSSRRFETTVDAFALSDRRNERRLLPELELVRKRAGKIRDMDVLTGYALGLNMTGEQDCLVQLIETLGARRAKQAGKLRRLVKQTGPDLRRRLKRSLRKLEKIAEHAGASKPASAMRSTEEPTARALTVSAELQAPSRLDRSNLHPYRLKVKELRYILQLSDHADEEPFVKELGAVKDAIGEWHDWEELTAIAAAVLRHGSDCKFLPKLKSISDQKYNHAFGLAMHLRQTYLKSKPPSGKRRPSRPTQPVLMATAGLSA